MNYFDLHCDTLPELVLKNLKFDNDRTAVNAQTVSGFEKYRQVFAVCTPPNDSNDKSFETFCNIAMLSDTTGIPQNGSILAIEGADMIRAKLPRLDFIYSLGCRLITLCWKERTCIGGSWDTPTFGLEPFGGMVLSHMFRLGIIPDLSHASEKTFYDCLRFSEKYGKPMICSHSNSRSVFDHPRNITDEQFGIIRDMKGIVGVSFCPDHLTDGECTVDSVMKHIDRYLEMGGEDTVCIGADFDGIDSVPKGLENPSKMDDLAEAMDKRGYGGELTDKIFYTNAAAFFDKNLTPAKDWES